MSITPHSDKPLEEPSGAEQPVNDVDEVVSLGVLRSTHAALTRRRRALDDSEEPEAYAQLLVDLSRFVTQVRSAGVVLEDEAEREVAQGFLTYWANVLYRSGVPVDDPIIAAFDPFVAPTLPDSACPYLGLDAFSERDHALFFGRRRVVEQLVERLEQNRLLVVIGPSGSGKSSVVRAGLLPALQRGAVGSNPWPSTDWVLHKPLVPGSQPVAALAAVLSDEGNASAATRLPRLPDDGPPHVIIVDQFEEIFTLCTDEPERDAFFAVLIDLICSPGTAHRVVLTMRSDFEPFMARAEALLQLFERAKFYMPPMSAGELRESIELPAEANGLRFEPGVVDALLQDIVGEPAALPLLQFTLLKLWEAREQNRVTLAGYRRVGGGRLALARAADDLYNSLILEDQVTAKRILLRMVRPGEGLEITSNRVRRADLDRSEDSGRVGRVLDKLAAARLVRFTPGKTNDETQIEVAHEALVRNWPTLVAWLEDERFNLRQRQRLMAAAEQWARLGRAAEALLRGALLSEASHYDDLNELEQAFVQASRTEQEREVREREAIIHRLEQLTAELARQRRLADIQRLAFAAQSQAQTDPEVALLLAAEAAAQDDNPVTRQALSRVLSHAQRMPLVLDVHRSPITAVTVSPTGDCFATGAADGLIYLWSGTGELIHQLSGHTHVVAAMAFSPDGGRLLSGARDGTARVWDIQRGRVRNVIREHSDTVIAVAWAPDGKFFVTASRDKCAFIWSPDGQRHILLKGHSRWLRDVKVSPDGRWIVTASRDQTARIWTPTGQLVAELTGHSDGLTHVLFSPDGQQFLTCSWDGDARLYPTDGKGMGVQVLRGHVGPITSVAFSPDNRFIATTSWDGTARLWDRAGQALETFRGQTGLLHSVGFRDDSRLLITGSSDGTTLVWTLNGHVVERLGGHTERIERALFMPNSDRLLTTSRDGTVRIWSAPAAPYPSLESHTGSVNAVATGPMSQAAVTASEDGVVNLWSDGALRRTVLRGGQPQRAVDISPDGKLIAVGGEVGAFVLGLEDEAHIVNLPHGAPVYTLAFSPSSQYVLTGGADRRAMIWTTSGELQAVCEGHEGTIRAVVWLRDGLRRFVTLGMDHSLRAWTGDGALLQTIEQAHSAWILSAALSLDGRRLMTGSADKTVCVWNVETWQRELVVSHSGWVEGLAALPDGTGFASASRDGTVRLWAWDGTVQNAFRGHVGGARSLAFYSGPRNLHIQ